MLIAHCYSFSRLQQKEPETDVAGSSLPVPVSGPGTATVRRQGPETVDALPRGKGATASFILQPGDDDSVTTFAAAAGHAPPLRFRSRDALMRIPEHSRFGEAPIGLVGRGDQGVAG